MFHRLVRRAVFAEADRIVREHPEGAQLHQRGHAQGVARVVGKGQESRAVGDVPAVQRDAVHDRRHAELAHAVEEVVPAALPADGLGARPQREVGACEICGTTEQFRQPGRKAFDRILRGLAGGNSLGLGIGLRDEAFQLRGKVLRQVARHASREFSGFGREGRRVGGEPLLPFGFAAGALALRIPRGGDLLRHHERRGCPTQRLAGGGDFLVAQRRAMRTAGVGLGRRALAYRRLAADQRGPAGFALCLADRAMHGRHIVAIDVGNHLPAVGGEPFRHIVRIPALDVALLGINRDPVVVVERNELPEAQRARQCERLVRDALHHATVTKEGVGVVIDDLVARLVEFSGEKALGDRHTHGIGDALAERSGGGFYARRDADFRVTGRLRVQLPEQLELRHREAVAGQVQQRIEQHRAVTVRQHEAVSVGPMRVRGVVLQVAVPECHRDFGHAHRHSGVA